jgi:hypothetical protein
MHGEMHSCKKAVLLLPSTPSLMLMFNSIRCVQRYDCNAAADELDVSKCCAISEFHGGEEFDCPTGLHGVITRIVTVCINIGKTTRDGNWVNQRRLADGLRETRQNKCSCSAAVGD